MITLPFGLSFADITAPPARDASSPGESVHSAAKARCLLQPQAPGAADVTFPAGTAGASAVQAAPPSPPSLQQPSGSQSEQVLRLLYSGCHPRFSRRRRPAPSSSCCCNGFPSPPPSRCSTALARLRGGRGLTSEIGKEDTPGCCSRRLRRPGTHGPRASWTLRNSNFRIAGERKLSSCA